VAVVGAANLHSRTKLLPLNPPRAGATRDSRCRPKRRDQSKNNPRSKLAGGAAVVKQPRVNATNQGAALAPELVVGAAAEAPAGRRAHPRRPAHIA
jgi:hypothetical protein